MECQAVGVQGSVGCPSPPPLCRSCKTISGLGNILWIPSFGCPGCVLFIFLMGILPWGLLGWEGPPCWCWGLIWKWTEKPWLGFSALDFGWQFLCAEKQNGKFVFYLLVHAVKYLRKDGMMLRFSWEKGESLSAFLTLDHAEQWNCRNGLLLWWHWSEQQLSEANCSLA